MISANYLKINIINKTFVVSKIASSLKITKLSLDKISECNQGPDILRLWVIPLSLPGGDKNKRKYVGTIWKAFVREPGGWLAWIMAKEGRRRKKGMDIFSRFDIRNPEIEITPDAQQTNVLFPSQARWNNFKVGWDKQSNFQENVCPQQGANMLQFKCDWIASYLVHFFDVPTVPKCSVGPAFQEAVLLRNPKQIATGPLWPEYWFSFLPQRIAWISFLSKSQFVSF